MGCTIGRRSPSVSPHCRDSVPSIRPTECGSLPTPSQQLVRLRPQRRAPTSHPDEVPKVKAGNKVTAAPFARARIRTCQSVSVFAFTPSPTCRNTLIHKPIGVKVLLEILHISLISRDFFFDNPLFFNVLPLFTTKKTEKPNNICNRRNHCAAHFFPSRVSVGATTHKPLIHGRFQGSLSAIRCSSRHGNRHKFPHRNGVKQSSRQFLTGKCEKVNPNRQSLHPYQTIGQHFAAYG